MPTSARLGGKSAYNKIKKHKLSSTGEAILAEARRADMKSQRERIMKEPAGGIDNSDFWPRYYLI